jgi:hypothetical protein
MPLTPVEIRHLRFKRRLLGLEGRADVRGDDRRHPVGTDAGCTPTSGGFVRSGAG